jgi:hypothetical protein
MTIRAMLWQTTAKQRQQAQSFADNHQLLPPLANYRRQPQSNSMFRSRRDLVEFSGRLHMIFTARCVM